MVYQWPLAMVARWCIHFQRRDVSGGHHRFAVGNLLCHALSVLLLQNIWLCFCEIAYGTRWTFPGLIELVSDFPYLFLWLGMEPPYPEVVYLIVPGKALPCFCGVLEASVGHCMNQNAGLDGPS